MLRMAWVLLLVLLTFSGACGQGKALTTGTEVEIQLLEQLRSQYEYVNGVECPDQDLEDGDSILCEVGVRGFRKDFRVTVHEDGDRVRLSVDLA